MFKVHTPKCRKTFHFVAMPHSLYISYYNAFWIAGGFIKLNVTMLPYSAAIVILTV